MKKAFIKFFVWLIFLLAICGTVFFFGWLQFAVPAGSYGVMLSKSGGYHNRLIMPGEFSWRWERLVPTNSKIIIFDLKPKSIEYKTSGVLALSEKFSIISKEKHDFSWKWGMIVAASIKPESLISFVKQKAIKSQTDMEEFLEAKISETSQICANEFIKQFMDEPEKYEAVKFQFAEFQNTVLKNLQKKLADEIILHSVKFSDEFKIPDLKLYNTLRDAYFAYEEQERKALIALSTERGQSEAFQKFSMDFLRSWGALLKEYPQLVDFLAVARNDATETLRALRQLKLNSMQEKKTDSAQKEE